MDTQASSLNPDAEDVFATASAWRDAGEKVAIATVTETWGSSPSFNVATHANAHTGP